MKVQVDNTSTTSSSNFVVYTDDVTSTNIHFTTPPPEGAVITADYYTDVIAKDSDHVFDISVTFNFGEYTE